MASLGCEFAGRYLGTSAEDLTALEIDDASSAHVGIVPIAHAYEDGWAPDKCPGRLLGEAMGGHAMAIRLPVGAELWADIEGVADGVTQEAMVLWSGGVARPVIGAGYVASAYIGARSACDSRGLYLLAFTGYWQSESEVPPVEVRGYRMIQ